MSTVRQDSIYFFSTQLDLYFFFFCRMLTFSFILQVLFICVGASEQIVYCMWVGGSLWVCLCVGASFTKSFVSLLDCLSLPTFHFLNLHFTPNLKIPDSTPCTSFSLPSERTIARVTFKIKVYVTCSRVFFWFLRLTRENGRMKCRFFL